MHLCCITKAVNPMKCYNSCRTLVVIPDEVSLKLLLTIAGERDPKWELIVSLLKYEGIPYC